MKKELRRNRRILFLASALFLIVALGAFVRADSFALYCIPEGELIDLGELCNPNMEKKVGPTTICMHRLDNGKICPTAWNKCNNLGLSCSPLNGTEVDLEPPNMEIFSPIEGAIYTSKSILLDLDPDEKSYLSYFDHNRPDRGWKQICSRCSRYERRKSFGEGYNNLTFRARDLMTNTAYFSRTFYIDSKKPRIKSSEPRRGYADGNFTVIFEEANPRNLTLIYGIPGIYEVAPVDLGACVPEGSKRTLCKIEVDLTAYDGGEIEYYFEITDIAGQMDMGKKTTLDVDITEPKILNFSLDKNGKYVMFYMEIGEANFERVEYRTNAENKIRWKTLCSRLDEGICEKRVTFKDGLHGVTVRVSNEAGSYTEEYEEFFIDTKLPKIMKTLPKKGFISGLFTIEFREKNPKSLTLHYGTSGTIGDGTNGTVRDGTNGTIRDGTNGTVRDQAFNISLCEIKNGKHICAEDVDIEEFNEMEIEYWFELADVMDNMVESRRVSVDVDTLDPVIESVIALQNGRRIDFIINITEENFDGVYYIDSEDSRGREKRMCSRLNGGLCIDSVSLRSGGHNLTIIAYDEAGNTDEWVESFIV